MIQERLSYFILRIKTSCSENSLRLCTGVRDWLAGLVMVDRVIVGRAPLLVNFRAIINSLGPLKKYRKEMWIAKGDNALLNKRVRPFS